MPRNQGLAVEMTLRGRKSVILSARSSRCPRSLETRTERGFPHFHSNWLRRRTNLPKLQNPPKSQGLSDSCAEPEKVNRNPRQRHSGSRTGSNPAAKSDQNRGRLGGERRESSNRCSLPGKHPSSGDFDQPAVVAREGLKETNGHRAPRPRPKEIEIAPQSGHRESDISRSINGTDRKHPLPSGFLAFLSCNGRVCQKSGDAPWSRRFPGSYCRSGRLQRPPNRPRTLLVETNGRGLRGARGHWPGET